MAVLALSILPVPHLHQSISGKMLVHSHLESDPVEHAGTLDHGDHHGVRTFPPVFTVDRTTDALAVFLVVTAFIGVKPEARSLAHIDALDAPVIHGPPLRGLSLRAPPA
jgi:hypothetical protein